MDWEKLDWTVLDRLRDGFLSGSAAKGPYWRSLDDLANYDVTYGERIGWKWDAVLEELRLRGWRPGSGNPERPLLTLLDWGCGSGIAGRRVVRAWGVERFSSVRLWDHSPLAREYARQRAAAEFPSLVVGDGEAADSEIDVLVLSHVLNEVGEKDRAGLLSTLRRSRCVIWVEPGTHAVSRALIELREILRTDFRVVAPCTHQAACGLLAPENARHWCHAFAPPPSAIYADSDWVKFGQRAGIDLRSLPYSFLALERFAPDQARSDEARCGRILGDARHYKGFAKLLNCSADGVSELTLQKRADPALFKALKRESGIPIYRWTRAGDHIEAGEKVYPPSTSEATS
jgi:SAM-dependent methyltransferase